MNAPRRVAEALGEREEPRIGEEDAGSPRIAEALHARLREQLRPRTGQLERVVALPVAGVIERQHRDVAPPGLGEERHAREGGPYRAHPVRDDAVVGRQRAYDPRPIEDHPRSTRAGQASARQPCRPGARDGTQPREVAVERARSHSGRRAGANPRRQLTRRQVRVHQLVCRELEVEVLPARVAHRVVVERVKHDVGRLAEPPEHLGLDVSAVGQVVEDRDAQAAVRSRRGRILSERHALGRHDPLRLRADAPRER